MVLSESTPSLSDLPPDILLYILQFCDLLTHVNLVTVCITFNVLSQQRGYWINALRNARLNRPIACPLREDLLKHDLQSLKRITFHTLRLERNWSSPEPQVHGPIKAVMLGLPVLDVIFQVPGTALYVLHSRSTGTIAAWDIDLGRRVTPEIRISRRVLDVSPGQDELGKFSMGLLTSGAPNNELLVICLEYGKADVNLSVILRYTLKPNMFNWAVFMTTGYVGVLQCRFEEIINGEGTTVDIVALNLSSKNATTIQTDIPREMFAHNEGQSGTSISNRDLFILVEWKDESHLFRCPKKYLPHDDNPDCPSTSSLKCLNPSFSHKWTHPGVAEYTDTEGALSADEFYGVPAVSLHRITAPRLDSEGDVEPDLTHKIQIRFWTKPEPDPGNEKSPPHLIPRHSVNIPGLLQDSPDSSWQLMLLPHSGRKVLLVVYYESEICLKLIHFDPEEGISFVQQVTLPPFINVEEVYGLSLDDHLGVISLLDTKGVLYAIPYA
ncbi:hypothetical protein CPB84DRAFT_1812360 [Gymnopilus junonius]|uniref:F-box domain-containing protein n=1 Tax=Gymnopilus junonius TaxID=109634 RepID=A0A9P5P0K9_GYMJU|nr:hypothetical protein CPB84DRAFT_1812360 [Gymnopilus junonius]